MKAFFRWCAGSAIAGIVLALLVCGSMMGVSPARMHDGGMAVVCADRGCAPMPQDCLLSCLAETDELEVRTVLSITVLVIGAIAMMFVPAPQVSLEFVRISAPPWRHHRLLVFRE